MPVNGLNGFRMFTGPPKLLKIMSVPCSHWRKHQREVINKTNNYEGWRGVLKVVFYPFFLYLERTKLIWIFFLLFLCDFLLFFVDFCDSCNFSDSPILSDFRWCYDVLIIKLIKHYRNRNSWDLLFWCD